MTADPQAPAPPAAAPEGGARGPCKWCDRSAAVIGLLAGAAVVFVAADLMLGGRLTAFVAGLLARGGQAQEEAPGDD